LAWVLYLLGQHSEALAKAQAEVDLVLGDAQPTVENTAELHWVEQCLEETLRLYPPIHLGSRTAAHELEFQGVQIPAGARVLYSIYLTHRHPQYWEAPDEFKPERFAVGAKREPYTYLPFGMGKRNCIGAVFAQTESRIVLTRILQRVALDTVGTPKARLHMGATLEPRPGVMMHVTMR
jgi:cytochrome P450